MVILVRAGAFMLALLGLVFSIASAAAEDEGVLDRIIRTGEIRCSYIIYPPYLLKDANSSKISGIFHDVIEEIAHNAGLDVRWVEEVGYDNMFVGLNSGRHDVFCGGLWPSAVRAKAGYFTIPIFYSVVKTWVRPDEERFQSKADIDSKDVRIAVIDGAMEDIIARSDFPNAKRLSLPQLSPFTQNLLNISSGKADITFAEPGIVHKFLENNPGALKEILADQPMRIFGNALVLKRGADELQEFLNIGMLELLYSGRVDSILRKYEPAPGVFHRVALPYRID